MDASGFVPQIPPQPIDPETFDNPQKMVVDTNLTLPE